MVNICTKRTIVADDYNELIIRYSISKKYYVEARPDTKKRIANKQEMQLLDAITYLGDQEILFGLINHFFDEITIDRFLINELVEGQIGQFDTFESMLQSKMLALQIAKSDLSLKIKEALRSRFYKGRSEFLKSNEDIQIYNIIFSNNEASYSKTENNTIYMSLYMKNPNKYETEMDFLREFIKEKLESKNSKAEVYDDVIEFDEFNTIVCIGRYIQCDNLLIRVSSEFISYLTDIIEEHNKMINKDKVKQLKMEGF